MRPLMSRRVQSSGVRLWTLAYCLSTAAGPEMKEPPISKVTLGLADSGHVLLYRCWKPLSVWHYGSPRNRCTSPWRLPVDPLWQCFMHKGTHKINRILVIENYFTEPLTIFFQSPVKCSPSDATSFSSSFFPTVGGTSRNLWCRPVPFAESF